MTRKEVTGFRDLTFSGWVRENLPDSKTGFMASDLDFFLWNYKTKKLIMLELKTYGRKPKRWQEIMWLNMEKWITNGIDSDWEFRGYHLIQFEKTNFENGKCYLDGKEITEKELIEFLSLN